MLAMPELRAFSLAAGRSGGEATLYINNPKICSSCDSFLPSMLPPGTTLNVVLPDGTVLQFKGINR
jgi:SCP1.201-like deaminase